MNTEDGEQIEKRPMNFNPEDERPISRFLFNSIVTGYEARLVLLEGHIRQLKNQVRNAETFVRSLEGLNVGNVKHQGELKLVAIAGLLINDRIAKIFRSKSYTPKEKMTLASRWMQIYENWYRLHIGNPVIDKEDKKREVTALSNLHTDDDNPTGDKL